MLEVKLIERALKKPGKTKGGLATPWASAPALFRRSCRGSA